MDDSTYPHSLEELKDQLSSIYWLWDPKHRWMRFMRSMFIQLRTRELTSCEYGASLIKAAQLLQEIYCEAEKGYEFISYEKVVGAHETVSQPFELAKGSLPNYDLCPLGDLLKLRTKRPRSGEDKETSELSEKRVKGEQS